jgi:hypothetical protein
MSGYLPAYISLDEIRLSDTTRSLALLPGEVLVDVFVKNKKEQCLIIAEYLVAGIFIDEIRLSDTIRSPALLQGEESVDGFGKRAPGLTAGPGAATAASASVFQSPSRTGTFISIAACLLVHLLISDWLTIGLGFNPSSH